MPGGPEGQIQPITPAPVLRGGLKETVRQELVARQLDEQMAARYPVGQRLRILDVGMGRGVQALRLARAGHTITGLESDAGLLRAAQESLATEPAGIRERVRFIEGACRETGVHFLPGSFDVVLCHGVLMSEQEPDAMLAGLARMLAPGGLLSLLVRNGDALALAPGLNGDWDGTLAAFDADIWTDRGGIVERTDRLHALTAALAGIAAPCTPGTACRCSPTGERTPRSPRPPPWNASWPPRTAQAAPTPIARSRHCCTCAGYGADARAGTASTSGQSGAGGDFASS